MAKPYVSPGFTGHRRTPDLASRIPPGQHLVSDFPVLSAGPTPRTPLEKWSLSVDGLVGAPTTWTWAEFSRLPTETFVVDIHCVTTWSKLDTRWKGVSLDKLFQNAAVDPAAQFITAFCDGGYTTNLAVTDLEAGKAMVAYEYDGHALAPEHGGPARLLVPHLYFWKSAKWVRGLELRKGDTAGFWERNGYNMYGDPFREQRFTGD